MKTTFVAVLMMAASTVAFADEMKCAFGTGSFDEGCDAGVVSVAAVQEPEVTSEMKCVWGTASFEAGCDVFSGACK